MLLLCAAQMCRHNFENNSTLKLRLGMLLCGSHRPNSCMLCCGLHNIAEPSVLELHEVILLIKGAAAAVIMYVRLHRQHMAAWHAGEALPLLYRRLSGSACSSTCSS